MASCSNDTGPSSGGAARSARLVAGNDFTCALDHQSDAFCWGAGSQGQLGDGAGQGSPIPVRVAGGPYRSLSAAQEGVCGLKFDGSVDCWGTVSLGCCNFASSQVLEPTPLDGASQLTQFTLAPFFACGIGRTFDGQCVGFDDDAQLGNALDSSTSFPFGPIVGKHKFTTLALGVFGGCALDTRQAAWCWGANIFGELGTGGDPSVRDSVPVPIAAGLQFTSLSEGSAYACGVTTTGETLCWGLNFTGQLGDGTVTNRNVPTPVPNAHFVSVFTGAKNAFIAHTCALDASGAASCWGLDDRGQLGGGATGTCLPNENTPCSLTPVPVAGNLSFTSLAVGDAQTCGTVADGHVYCWGGNADGELGDGTTLSSSTPVLSMFTP